jgi:hypothetical protein
MKKIIEFFQKFTFPTIIALSALSVSLSAAFYSVTGLSKLFAGASFEVMVMAASLEIAKLVVASLLYQYWKEINKFLRLYLSIAAFVLVLITSAGIYGFLSAAYQETATKSEMVDKEISVIQLKKTRFEENRIYYIGEKTKLDESINNLRGGLSNNVIQYRDRETGQILTTQSTSNRKTLEKQLTTAVQSRDELGIKLEAMTDSISNLDLKILDIQSNSDLASELGPLKYLSELTKIPMNKIVNYLLLVIVFVFDPLAISLVIAANFAFKVARTKKIGNVDDVFEKEIKTENMDDDEKNIDTSTESFIYSFDEFKNPSTFPNNVQYKKESKPIYDMEELGMLQQASVELPEEEINQMSTEAGKLEYRKESERFIPTEEFLERLQGELNKIEQKKTQLEKEEKTNSTETDLEKLEKYLQIIKSKETIIDKPEKTITLKKKQPEVIEENENIEDMDVTLMDGLEEEQIFEEKDEFLGTDTTYEEEKKQENEDPNPQPKQRLTYQKRDGGRNITVSRF